MNITMTTEQYNAIRQLKYLAQYYVDEHAGDGFARNQYLSDLADVQIAKKVLDDIDQRVSEEL